MASEYTTYSWSPRSPKLEGTLPTGPMGWSRLWVRALVTQHDADDPDDHQHDEQVPCLTAIASASYDLRVYTAPAYTGSSSPAARFTKYLTIYRKIIVSLSSDRLTIVTSKVLKFLLE